MTEDPAPHPVEPDAPAPAEEKPPIFLLPDDYLPALLGWAVSASEHPRAVYSLSKLVSIQRTAGGMPYDAAQMSVIRMMQETTTEHSARAPIFVDDAISQPTAEKKPEGRIIRPPGGFRPRRR